MQGVNAWELSRAHGGRLPSADPWKRPRAKARIGCKIWYHPRILRCLSHSYRRFHRLGMQENRKEGCLGYGKSEDKRYLTYGCMCFRSGVSNDYCHIASGWTVRYRTIWYTSQALTHHEWKRSSGKVFGKPDILETLHNDSYIDQDGQLLRVGDWTSIIVLASIIPRCTLSCRSQKLSKLSKCDEIEQFHISRAIISTNHPPYYVHLERSLRLKSPVSFLHAETGTREPSSNDMMSKYLLSKGCWLRQSRRSLLGWSKSEK